MDARHGYYRLAEGEAPSRWQAAIPGAALVAGSLGLLSLVWHGSAAPAHTSLYTAPATTSSVRSAVQAAPVPRTPVRQMSGPDSYPSAPRQPEAVAMYAGYSQTQYYQEPQAAQEESSSPGVVVGCVMVIVAVLRNAWKGRAAPAIAMATTSGEKVDNQQDAAAQKWADTLLEIEEVDKAILARKKAQEEAADSLVTKFAVFTIPLAASAFILQAYFFGTPVAQLLSRNGWLFLHVVGGMFFGGIVIFSTLYEGLVILQGDPGVKRWWFDRVPLVDGIVALPSVFITIASGVCLSQVNFGGLALAPKWVCFALELLLVFVAFWAVMDTSTQGPAKDVCDKNWKTWMLTGKGPEVLPDVLQTRLWVNAVSSSVVVAIYFVMTQKPNFKIEDLFM